MLLPAVRIMTGTMTATAVIAGGATTAALQPSTASQLVDIAANLAPFASIILSCSPFPTIRELQAKGSVGNMPLLPYTSMVANAFLWTTYGLLKKESKIIQPNAVGLVLGLYYFVSFLKIAPRSSPTLPGSVTTHTQGILALFMSTLFVASSQYLKNPVEVIGKAGVVMCIAMFASPLAALKSVIQQKSAQSIALPFSIASFVNCFLWTVTGVYKMKDVNIYLPNFLGLLCAVAQITLKIIYGSGGSDIKKVDIPI